MSRSTHILLLLLASQACHVQRTFAQQPSAPPARRWEISVDLGYSFGSTASQFEDVMRASGLDDPESCWLFCSGTISNPHSRGALTTGIAISYAFRDRWALRLERVSADLGETMGYHDPLIYLFLHSTVTTMAPVAVYSVTGRLRIGAGPAINSVQVTRTDAPGGPGWHTTRVGFVLLGRVVSSERRRVFFEGTARYDFVGSPAAGPFVSQALGGPGTAVMPRTRISFSYASIHVGLGLRF